MPCGMSTSSASTIGAHAPALQVAPRQSRPQRPQFFGSFETSTHAPPHDSEPVAHPVFSSGRGPPSPAGTSAARSGTRGVSFSSPPARPPRSAHAPTATSSPIALAMRIARRRGELLAFMVRGEATSDPCLRCALGRCLPSEEGRSPAGSRADGRIDRGKPDPRTVLDPHDALAMGERDPCARTALRPHGNTPRTRAMLARDDDRSPCPLPFLARANVSSGHASAARRDRLRRNTHARRGVG